MTYKTELIVLHTTKVGERSVVVHALSSLWGRRSFLCSVGKAFSLANFQSLSLLEATIVSNPKSDLWRIKEFSALSPLNGLRTNAAKSSISMFIAEVLYRVVHDDADIFQWCKKEIFTLDALESNFSNFHLRFLMELSAVLGFSPRCEDFTPFAEGNLKEIKELLLLDLAGFLAFPLNGKKRCEIADSLLRYLSFHTQSILNIRSLEVLKSLF